MIIVNYCCTRVLLYAKMLKETETEETIVFFGIFIIGSISVGGGEPSGPSPPLAPPMVVDYHLHSVIVPEIKLCPI